MKRYKKKRIVRRRRRISEREIMRIKRKLKKSARKLRLGAKRTGAYVYGTLRRIVGNPARGFSRTGFDTSSGTTYGQLASFLASGRHKENRTIASNTYVIRYGDGSIGVVLYQTRILHYHPNGEVDVNFGGWLTPTTFNRVNALIPYGWRIGKKKGQLVIHNYLGEKAVIRQPKGAEGYAVRLTPEKAYLIV